jgi:hypothetical protein
MKKLVILLTVLFCAGAIACANWDAMSPSQKADLACNVTVDLVKPECLRLDESRQDECVAVIEAVSTACVAVIEKDASQVCPFVKTSASKCVEVFDKPVDVSSCQRAFAAAYLGCVLNAPPAPVEPAPAE